MTFVYEKLLRPIFFLQDPEKIHDRATRAGKIVGAVPPFRWLVSLFYTYKHPILEQEIAGIHFRNPVGLAAGFDKDCHLMKALPALGFGYEEVGSVTAEPYEGNPKPRLKRLKKDEGIIVNYGLKNEGAAVLKKRLQGKKFSLPVGVSVAKTNKLHTTQKEKLDDWVRGIRAMKDAGAYLTINLSCPNTYDPANFCDPNLLEKLLWRLENEKMKFNKPVFLKLSADVSIKELNGIIAACKQRSWITGFVVSNLVKDRTSVKFKSKKKHHEPYKGGISGPLVKEKALALITYIRKKSGKRFVLIGCGGISTAEDAYEYILAGASLVQLITGMIYHGPGTVKEINKGLVKLLERDGYARLSEAVGTSQNG